MALVGYSESDSSEAECVALKKPYERNEKLKFHKVIDKSNPHKIKVNIPGLLKAGEDKASNDDAPPLKRIKTTSGGLGGFNALLPAPKRGQASVGDGNGCAWKDKVDKGVTLKTGASPGFSREPVANSEASEVDCGKGFDIENPKPGFSHLVDGNLLELSETPNMNAGKPIEEMNKKPVKHGNAMIFKPLSVARKPPKKRGQNIDTAHATQSVTDQGSQQPLNAAPKIPLFSYATPEEITHELADGRGEYQPIVYQTQGLSTTEVATQSDDFSTFHDEPSNIVSSALSQDVMPPAQSLDSIAHDLHLSASAKRQLLGRQKGDIKGIGNAIPVNIVNFNTDAEYAANELLRQAGEQQQHNPVRAVAAGKHSLKQLVNAASTQKEALEEHFASGKRNKKEAGSRYGW